MSQQSQNDNKNQTAQIIKENSEESLLFKNDDDEIINVIKSSVDKLNDKIKNVIINIDNLNINQQIQSESTAKFITFGNEIKQQYEKDAESRKKIEQKIGIIDKLSKRLEND